MQNVFEVLEWDRLLAKVAGLTRTEKGKAKALALRPLPLEELKKETLFLSEMEKAYYLLGRLPIDSSSDLSSKLEFARKQGCLNVEDFERIAHDITLVEDVRRYFDKAYDSPSLKEKSKNLPNGTFLEKDIHKVIAPDLSIYDNASPKLRQIRIGLARLEKTITQSLGTILQEHKEYLSDSTLTLRNGHYVLPVANTYKHKVGGIVQDVSGSGGTTFIEPEKIVRLNNQLTILKNDELEEIHRILLELSMKVGSFSSELQEMNEALGYFDFLQAKAMYGEAIKGHIASLSNNEGLFLPGARHPLLDPSKVVPNDFALSPKTKAVIISGPNAGGKTVALKTIGILTLMFESALPLPTLDGAIVPYYKNVYLDIGDSQSLQDNLSTFSGHMANIGAILNLVGGKDLVLLDEVGTGTSPKEGEALAKSITEALMAKHATSLISSHFEGLKAFAFEHQEIENASMLFDEEKLLPTYRIKMGLPGESYGLKVARRFGLPETVIEKAEKELSNASDLRVSDAIARLGEITRQTEALKEDLEKKEQQYRVKENDLSKRENILQGKEEHYLETVKKEKEELLAKAETKIKEIMDGLSSPEVKLHQAIEAKRKLEDLKEKQAELTFDTEVSIGDYVKIASLGIVGKVTRVNNKKVSIVTRDGMSFETSKDKLQKAKAPEEKVKKIEGRVIDDLASGPSLSLELNIIGLHVDEALIEIDHYLDRCRRKGFERVRIIHGYGSGALRKATHEYLKSHGAFVKKFELGGEFEGGSGATVVYLK